MQENMRIPSKQDCLELMCAMDMMEHIAAHSLMVCHVAVMIADGLAGRGVSVNRNLVSTASMLHDITKTRSFATGENHAMTGDRLLRERGYDEVASIVGQHVRLDAFSDSEPPTEAEIVNYADKRVLHDKVVTLKERMAYIVERYGESPDLQRKLRRLWRESETLEAKLFSCLAFSPDEISLHIDRNAFHTDLSDFRRICSGNGKAAS